MPLKIEAQKIIPSCIDVCFKTIMSPADALRLVRIHLRALQETTCQCRTYITVTLLQRKTGAQMGIERFSQKR